MNYESLSDLELDTRLAEFMGWKKAADGIYFDGVRSRYLSSIKDIRARMGITENPGLWSPSTSIADAWIVVERLTFQRNSLNALFSLIYDWDYGIDKRHGWSVTIDGISVASFQESAARAISIGALRYTAPVVAARGGESDDETWTSSKRH